MESIKLYYYKENDEIISVDTEQIDSKYLEINVKNEDDFVKKITLKNIRINEEIYDKLREIFDSENSATNPHTEYANDKNFIIKHWVSNRSFGELIDMYENEEIKVPDMQRPFVWDSFRSSRLIESIVMGLPIPPLFLLETDNNAYEVIDGYQRLTTLYNYVNGYPWSGYQEGKRNVTSRLSKNLVISSIRGKAFKELNDDQKKMIKRSTVPLIEFKQLNPENFASKYLIFERINTGSEKLSSMQIRKSLAYGDYIKDLYNAANNQKFISLFSNSQLKKDIHVEAFLRIIAISDIVYLRYSPTQNGLENILNEYCERKKEECIPQKKVEYIFESISELKKVFKNTEIFRRVNSKNNYEGLMNISILESLIGTIVECKSNNEQYIIDDNRYKDTMKSIYEESISGNENNPFSFSTGAIESMKKRFAICESIINRERVK